MSKIGVLHWLDITEIELNVMTSQRLSGWVDNVNQRYRSIAYERRNMSKIKKLKQSIDGKCASEDYKQVNKCINEIICDEQKEAAIKELKALICQLEGNGNQANAYTVMGICYSFAIGAISIVGIVSNEERVLFSIILSVAVVVVVVVLALAAMIIKKISYKEAFILKALNFKLEELNNKNPSVQNDKLL